MVASTGSGCVGYGNSLRTCLLGRIDWYASVAALLKLGFQHLYVVINVVVVLTFGNNSCLLDSCIMPDVWLDCQGVSNRISKIRYN